MAKNYSVESRNELKLQLLRERSILAAGSFAPICPICGHGVGFAMDMHEAIITRGDLSGSIYQEKIMVAENCVIVHHETCHSVAQTNTGQRRCIKNLLFHEGYINIHKWLIELDSCLKGNQALDALRLVKEIHYGD